VFTDDVCRCLKCSVERSEDEGVKRPLPWIGVDLDGTLAHYSTWVSADHIGEPIAPMVERVKRWLDDGKRVKIMTARAAGPYEPKWLTRNDIVNAIDAWCLKNIGQKLEVTNEKDMFMIELWDDRAVQVEPNVGEPVTYWTSRVD
jgi:hypothetical protein